MVIPVPLLWLSSNTVSWAREPLTISPHWCLDQVSSSMQSIWNRSCLAAPWENMGLLKKANSSCSSVSHSVVSDFVQPHGLQSARLLCPWGSPRKNTGVGCHFLLKGIFPTLGLNAGSSVLQADSLPSEPPGKPWKGQMSSCKSLVQSKLSPMLN